MPTGVYPRTPEHLAKIGEGNRGKKQSEETRTKISKALRGKKKSPEHIKKVVEANRGRKTSDETRKKMSEAKLGKKQTPEHAANAAASRIGKKKSPEFCAAVSERSKGKRNDGTPARGFQITPQGYRDLTGQQGHPLANKNGTIAEHRKVLYDEIGPGPHECYWNNISQCGNIDLQWIYGSVPFLEVDHLDADRANNVLSNLVPACRSCNQRRGQVGNPLDWDGTVATLKTSMGILWTTETQAKNWVGGVVEVIEKKYPNASKKTKKATVA